MISSEKKEQRLAIGRHCFERRQVSKRGHPSEKLVLAAASEEKRKLWVDKLNATVEAVSYSGLAQPICIGRKEARPFVVCVSVQAAARPSGRHERSREAGKSRQAV